MVENLKIFSQKRFFVFMDYAFGESVEYDILGIVIAHTFYYLSEVYPKLPTSSGALSILEAPNLL
jgi:hypothetical protein